MQQNKLITVASGATLTICGDFSGVNSDAITVDSGGSLIITGVLLLQNSFTLTINGTASIGSISIGNGGTLNVAGGGQIEVTGNVTAGNSASVVVSTGGVFEIDGNLTIGGGTITSNGLLNVNGTITGSTATGSGVWCSSPTPSSVATNDYVWRGVYSTDWSNVDNWLQKSSTGYSEPISLPESTKNVTISANTGCSNSNFPSIVPSTLDLKNLIIESGASLTIASGLINVYGNWTNNGTFTSNSNSTVAFKGTVNQTISGSISTTFGNLIMNNAAGLTVSKGFTVNTSLTFTSGNISASSSSEAVTFGTSATSSGAADTRCIVGYCKKNTNSTNKFTFPVGTSSLYRSASITPSSSSATSWTAKYYGAGHGDYTVTGPMLINPSRTEYWTIDRSGSSNSQIELSWGSNSNVNSSFATDIVVVHYNGTDWENIGGNNISGTISSGLVSSDLNWNVYSPFTIGSKTGAMPLPTELISFKAIAQKEAVKLDWQTASEIDHDYFTVERSFDGIHFSPFTRLEGLGNSNQTINYSVNDYDYVNGINYYRLIQTDYNGEETISRIESVDMSNKYVYFIKTINSLGQEVNETNKGIVFDIYSDGTSIKRIQF
jgi:hypothetical protein